MSTTAFRKSSFFRFIAFIVLTTFVGLLPAQPGYAQVAIVMPPVGQMIHVTSHFDPPQMVGLKINLKDPFSFGFIMDQGENPMSDSVKKEEFNKIVKYFLVSLAMPNKDMWVNLSPYESKRIIPEVFAQTEMGRDLLAQDYVLKQFTASLMYPESGLGKEFWDKVYGEAQARFGTTDINVNTFNKVWIVADHADVYQKGDTAFLVGSHLKVMLEQDFKAIEQNKEQFGDVSPVANDSDDAKTQMASQLVREIIIPAIEKEVNEGQSFAAVRQIYNAEIMATWFKKTLRESLLGQVFADKSKIAGQRVSDPQAKEKIFQQYLRAYKRGVFNYIKREVTPDGQVIPRRYLSGGFKEVPEALVTTVPSRSSMVDVLSDILQNEPQGSEQVAGIMTEVNQPNASIDTTEMREKINALAAELKDKENENMEIAKKFIMAHLPPTIKSEEPMALPTANNLAMIAQTPLPNVTPEEQRKMREIMEPLLEQPTIQQQQEVQTFSQEALAPEKTLDLAMVNLAPTAGNLDSAQEVKNMINALAQEASNIGEINREEAEKQLAAKFELSQKLGSQNLLQLMGNTQNNLQAEYGPQIRSVGNDNEKLFALREAVNTSATKELSDNMSEEWRKPLDFLKPAVNLVVANVFSEAANEAQNRVAQELTPNITPPAVTTAGDLIGKMSERPEVSPATIAAMVEHFNQPTATASEIAPQIQDLADQIQQLKAQQGAEEAVRALVSERLAAQRSTPVTATTVGDLIGKMSERPEVSPLEIAAMVEHYRQPTATASEIAPQIQDLADQIQQLKAQQGAEEAVRALVSERLAAQRSTPVTATTVGDLIGKMSERPEVSPLEIAAMVEHYRQPTATAREIAPQIQDLADQIQQLKAQQGAEEAVRALVSERLAAQRSTPVTATTVGDLIGKMSERPEVSPATIAAMVEHFNQPTATAREIAPQIQDLADQIQQLKQVQGAAVQKLISEQLSLNINQNETMEKNGGINLSNEHLTMNIKVDGKGMPLPPQYQDPALMNINGLVSVIRSITPLTPQNVPALYELTK